MTTCPKCDFSNEEGMNFCGRCGHAFTTSESTDRERRQVTVLFSDIVNFTSYTASIDDDDVPEVLEIYQDIVRKAVSKQKGYVAQFLGDGIVAYFGYPIAQESSAEHAIKAGLDIIDAIESMSHREYDLQVRVGVHQGSGVVTNVSDQGRILVGNTPNIAARMQGIAEPNTLVISEPTYNTTRGLFVCKDLGPRSIKGLKNLLKIYQVLNHKEVGRFDIELQHGVGRLAGRDPELNWLNSRLNEVRDGKAKISVVLGEPGIGKSRVVHEFHTQTQEQAKWLIHHCSAYRQDSALVPLKGLLAPLIGLSDLKIEGTRRSKIENFLSSLSIVERKDREMLIQFLDTENEVDLQINSLTNLLSRMIEKATESFPLVLLIEDAHWIDPSTLEVLKRIIQTQADSRLLVILTARPSFSIDRLAGAPIKSITLGKLSESELSEVINNRLQQKVIRSEVPAFIISKADGNPLYAEELTNALLRTGVIIEKNGQVQLDLQRGFQIPDTLKDALATRVDELGLSRHTAQVAAVLGREFDSNVLQEILGDHQEPVSSEMRRLESMQIIEPLRESTYLFRHDLLRDAIYDSLVRQQREKIHRVVAYTLETKFNGTSYAHPELLAQHWKQANEPLLAIDYYRTAGARFTERSAHREAIVQCKTALTLIGEQPQSLKRDELELDLLLTLGACMNSVDGYASPEKYQDVLLPALKLGERLNKPLVAFPVQYGLWSHQLGTGDKDGTEAWNLRLKQTIEAYENADNHMHQCYQFASGTTQFWQAGFNDAITAYDSPLDTYESAHHHMFMGIYGEDPGLYARLYRQWAYLFLGRVNLAQELASESNEFAKSLNDPLAEVMALAFNLHVTRDLGQLDKTLDKAHQLISLSEREGYPYYFAVGITFRDWSLFRLGQQQETVASAKVRIGETFGLMASTGLRDHAEIQLSQGNLDTAFELIKGAESRARGNLDCLYMPDVLRVKAEILYQLDLPEQSIEAYRESLNSALAWGENYWAVKTATSQLVNVGHLVRSAPDILGECLADVEGLGSCLVYDNAHTALNATI